MNSSPISLEDIRSTYDKYMQETNSLFLDFPWEDSRFYANWVAQSYYFLCHATRLLCHAGAHFDVQQNEALHLRCLAHSQQEMRHEKLALADLENLGYARQDFPELPITAQLYQSQYYLISFDNPCAIFGSVLYLEGLSVFVGKEIYKRARAAHGEGCTSFLNVHVTEDVNHISQAFEALNDLTPEQRHSVLWSLQQNHTIYVNMLETIRKNENQDSLSRVA